MNDVMIQDLLIDDVPSLNNIKPDDWGSIAEIHAHYLRTSCSKCIKVINKQNEILGIGTGLVFDQTGWLAHIIVSKDHQHKGIGTLIVRDRVRSMQERYQCKMVTLTATDQGYPLYKKLGFREESMYVIMMKPQDLVLKAGSCAEIVKATPDDFNQILEIDRVTSGERRDQLLRPLLDTAYVYGKNGSIQGFYLPQFGDGGVAAITEEAGIALLKERMLEDKKIFIPEENRTAYKFLVENGYKEVKRIHRMILGNGFLHNPQKCYSRIGGFAG